MKIIKVLSNPWSLAQLAVAVGALMVFALGPGSRAWNGVAWIAMCSSLALSWARSNYGPKSSSPDKVVLRTVLLIALVCIANRIWLALR